MGQLSPPASSCKPVLLPNLHLTLLARLLGVIAMPLCTSLSWLMRHNMSRPFQITQDKYNNKNSVDTDNMKWNQGKRESEIQQASGDNHMLFWWYAVSDIHTLISLASLALVQNFMQSNFRHLCLVINSICLTYIWQCTRSQDSFKLLKTI